MAFLAEDFVKAVPSSFGPLFQVNPVPASGLEVWLQNLSDQNTVNWKVQDSDDGVVWVDRPFNTTDCQTTATTFALLPSAVQSLRITKKKDYVRLVASAVTGTTVQIKTGWQKPVPLSGTLYLQG